MHPSRRMGSAVLAAAALTLTSCASVNVGTYVQRGSDVGSYRTYAWAPSDRLETGDPRLDNNPFFQERVQATVEQQLAARGFERTTAQTPELLVHYHASIEERIDVNRADEPYDACADCRPYVYDAGTLLIDFVDARTNQLVWRGWTETNMDGAIDNQDYMEERIEKAVTRILAKLPRRL